MKLTQRLLVLLITISMLLSGSFVQTFAAEETEDGNIVAVTEESSEETADETEAVNEDVPAASDTDAEEAAPEEEEPEAEPEAVTETTEAVEEAAPAEVSEGSIAYECDDYTVVLEYGKNAGIPAGTTLEVREILADSKDKKEKEEYEKYHDEALDALKKERAEDNSVSEDIASLGFARFFDITLISDGKEIEPTGDVSVKITFNKDAREAVSKTENAENDLRVVHITENEKTGKLEAAALDKKDTELSLDRKELSEASFTTDSFSVYGIVYTVDFEYEGYAFSIEGESEILISELFERLHIEEEASKVENVEFTDYELIKVEQTDGDWKLISLKPFDTEEKLTITLPDKVIEIKVTDAQSGNTFVLSREAVSNEHFRVRVFSSRAGLTATQVGTASTPVTSDGSFGWNSIDSIMSKYYNTYSSPRYSVVSSKDSTTNTALCAVGFQESRITGVTHGAFGLFTEQAAWGARGNGSATNYDLDITLNDNSIPVQIYVNGNKEKDDIYLNTSEKNYTSKEIAEAFGYTIGSNGYIIESSTINGQNADSVLLSELTNQSLAGKRYQIRGTSITVIGVSYRFDAFDYTYPKAYKWTYNNGTAVGDNAYVIRLEEPIARVKSGNGDWTYHSQLINSGTQGDGTTKKGAFDQANSLSGDVVVEMLYDTHERYTLGSGFTFNNTDIDSLTIKGTGNKSTLVKNQTASTIVPMITTTGIDKVELNKMIFNGNDQITTNAHGGAVNTNAAELSVNSCEFKNCQAGYQGGGINHNNINGTVVIDDSTFTSCRANGPKDEVGAGGGGVYTNAQSLTVTDSSFDSCTTKVRQGAGLFHQRAKTDPANSEASIKDCTFKDCEAKWSGGGMESDAWTVTLDTVEFTNCKATKGGAINVWADGQDSTSNDTTLNVINCKFVSCTGSDNGGAIRSTSLHTNITDSVFEGCSTDANGGAVNCTSNKTITTVTGCTFTDCHADSTADKCGNGGAICSAGTAANATIVTGTTIEGCTAAKSGGAIRSGNITINSGAITNCTAGEKGGAVHSTQTITMTGGSVTGCTTSGDSAALDANTAVSGLTFSGNVVVEGNTGSGGEARDVYLGTDTDRHIRIAGDGLGETASVGIYADDANSAFDKHGQQRQLFAWTGNNGGRAASSFNNLDKFFNDRVENLHGMAAVEGSGDNWKYRIMWSNETPVAPTGYNSKYIPFILILIGGAALVMLKKTADRRRRSEDDSDEDDSDEEDSEEE